MQDDKSDNIIQLQPRLWTGKDGKFRTDASFVKIFQRTKVKLQKVGGGTIAVPLERLSDPDVDYLISLFGLEEWNRITSTTIETTSPSQTNRMTSATTETTSPSQAKQQLHTIGPTSTDLSSPLTTLAQSMAALSTNAPRMPLSNNSTETKSLSSSRSMPLFSTDQLDEHKQPHYSNSIHSTNPLSRAQSIRPAQYHPNFAPINTSTRKQQQQRQRPRRTLDQLPNNILINIGSYLDVRSRLLFSRTSKRSHAMMMQRDVWHTVGFSIDDVDFINDTVMQSLIHLLLRFQLHYALRHVIVDHTQLSGISIGQLLQFFPAIRLLSLRHCHVMDYHQLANILDGLSASALSSSSISSGSSSNDNNRRGAVCRPDLKSFRMISKAPMHGTDIKSIHMALERLAQHAVMMDCYVCDECGVNACPATLTCLHCGILVMKRCKACAPVCDQCHGRVCGGTSCQIKPDIQLILSDCGGCEQPLPLCSMHDDDTARKCTSNEDHGLFHARCRIKNKWVSNRCTGCGIIACPFCDLSKCGGGCRGQWCEQCVKDVDLHYCKCILIHGVVGSKITKRMVCGQCRQVCPRCVEFGGPDATSFCSRCLDLHQQECAQPAKSKSKKSNRKNGK